MWVGRDVKERDGKTQRCKDQSSDQTNGVIFKYSFSYRVLFESKAYVQEIKAKGSGWKNKGDKVLVIWPSPLQGIPKNLWKTVWKPGD